MPGPTGDRGGGEGDAILHAGLCVLMMVEPMGLVGLGLGLRSRRRSASNSSRRRLRVRTVFMTAGWLDSSGRSENEVRMRPAEASFYGRPDRILSGRSKSTTVVVRNAVPDVLARKSQSSSSAYLWTNSSASEKKKKPPPQNAVPADFVVYRAHVTRIEGERSFATRARLKSAEQLHRAQQSRVRPRLFAKKKKLG